MAEQTFRFSCLLTCSCNALKSPKIFLKKPKQKNPQQQKPKPNKQKTTENQQQQQQKLQIA